MDFLAVANLSSRKKADLIVLPFWRGKSAEAAANIEAFSSEFSFPIASKDFIGKEGEVLLLYSNKTEEKRIVLVGLGSEDKITVELLRRAYSNVVKLCRQKKIKEINLVLPHIPALPEENTLKGICEGILSTNYTFDKLKNTSLKNDPTTLVSKVTFIGVDKSEMAQAEYYLKIFQGVYLARDLVNDMADYVTPQYLCHIAADLAKKHKKIKATIFDKKRIVKEKMDLLLAVSQGSAVDPAFIILEYKGNPKSQDTTVLVGKGVTYDTGGLHLKPFGGMETMRSDMGGAAAVLGTFLALALTGEKINVTGVIPTTENAIGPSSYKPGDVYSSHSGKTVEIGNTDAEGRLVLADALSYTVTHLKPTRIIDFATLTGAIGIALGSEVTGLMSTEDDLANALIKSGEATYERLCRLPLYEEYREYLKSDFADIKNVGGRAASAILGATFLKEFVNDVPWAHCDIASTAFLGEPKRYLPKYATGIGVRLMLDFFANN